MPKWSRLTHLQYWRRQRQTPVAENLNRLEECEAKLCITGQAVACIQGYWYGWHWINKLFMPFAFSAAIWIHQLSTGANCKERGGGGEGGVFLSHLSESSTLCSESPNPVNPVQWYLIQNYLDLTLKNSSFSRITPGFCDVSTHPSLRPKLLTSGLLLMFWMNAIMASRLAAGDTLVCTAMSWGASHKWELHGLQCYNHGRNCWDDPPLPPSSVLRGGGGGNIPSSYMISSVWEWSAELVIRVLFLTRTVALNEGNCTSVLLAWSYFEPSKSLVNGQTWHETFRPRSPVGQVTDEICFARRKTLLAQYYRTRGRLSSSVYSMIALWR